MFRQRVALLVLAMSGASCAPLASPGTTTPVGYTLVDARRERTHRFIGSATTHGACAIVHVDGFDNTLYDARANFDAISAEYVRAGGQCRAYGFAWRSDHGLLGLRAAEREVDKHAGDALAAFLAELEADYAAGDIQLTAHSLGARVVLRALALRARAGGPAIGAVALVAPAVATKDVLPGGELFPGIASAQRIAIFHNSRDRILRFFFPLFAGGHAALGQRGFGTHLATSTWLASLHGVALIDVECAPLWGGRHSAQKSFDACFWRLYFAHVGGTPRPSV